MVCIVSVFTHWIVVCNNAYINHIDTLSISMVFVVSVFTHSIVVYNNAYINHIDTLSKNWFV